VVEDVKGKHGGSLVGRALVGRIFRLVDDWKVVVYHVYGESNQCADALANVGCNMFTDVSFFDSCPHEISHLLTADSLGISIPRDILM
jgi:hypothetical protein